MRRGPDSLRRTRSRRQAGFALFEVIGAMMVVSIGLVGVLTAFDMANKTAFIAQRHEQAIAYGQAEIERLKTLKFNQLALTSQPTTSGSGNPPDDPNPDNPLNPNFYVTSTGFKIMNDYHDSTSGTVSGTPTSGEPFVVDATNGQVNPGPQTFTTGQTTGKIYRYVTWRDENCANCTGNQDSKRITVAISIDPVGNGAPPTKPIYVSSVLTDPEAQPPSQSNPVGGTEDPLQLFYLHDTPCGDADTRQAQTGSHPTRNTAESGSDCTTTDRPDLMGKNPASGLSTDPIYDYSTDLTGRGETPQGLALARYNTICPTSYPSVDASTLKRSVHTWATQPFPSEFRTPTTSPWAALRLFVRSVGGVAGSGILCATLRRASDGAVLSATSFDQQWPTTFSELYLPWNLSPAFTIAAGDRILLTISVKETSTTDIEVLYDHPLYPSFLAVATTTPLT